MVSLNRFERKKNLPLAVEAVGWALREMGLEEANRRGLRLIVAGENLTFSSSNDVLRSRTAGCNGRPFSLKASSNVPTSPPSETVRSFDAGSSSFCCSWLRRVSGSVRSLIIRPGLAVKREPEESFGRAYDLSLADTVGWFLIGERRYGVGTQRQRGMGGVGSDANRGLRVLCLLMGCSVKPVVDNSGSQSSLP